MLRAARINLLKKTFFFQISVSITIPATSPAKPTVTSPSTRTRPPWRHPTSRTCSTCSSSDVVEKFPWNEKKKEKVAKFRVVCEYLYKMLRSNYYFFFSVIRPLNWCFFFYLVQRHWSLIFLLLFTNLLFCFEEVYVFEDEMLT